MKGFTRVGAVALLCVLPMLAALGEEKKDAAVAPAAAAIQAKAGDKGEVVGVITAKKGGRLTVKSDAGESILMPYWRGGAPKDGGGFDEITMKRIALFKVGDKVKVAWTMEEHMRIDSIKRAD